MRIKKIKIFDNKGVSLMLSYILLISIGVILAISVFSWLRLVANVEPVISCEEGTSLSVLNTVCTSNLVTLTINNNGRFNLNGVLITVGNDSNKIPLTPLIPFNDLSITDPKVDIIIGQYLFHDDLKPGENLDVIFESPNLDYIRNMRVIPLIISGDEYRVVCTENIVKYNVDCFIGKG